MSVKKSIIMTLFNRPQSVLISTLGALGQCDLRDTEILLVDDGSTIPYEPLIEMYVKGGCPLRYEKIDTVADRPDTYSIDGHNNPAYAYNCALELAQGKTVFFMSSDCLVQPHTITMAMDLDLTNVVWMPSVIDTATFSLASARGHYLSAERVAPFGWFFATDRKNVEAVKWDEEFLKGIAFEDNDFMARLALHAKRFVVEMDCVALHQSHPPTAYSDEFAGFKINEAYIKEKWGGVPWHSHTGLTLDIQCTHVNTQMVLDVSKAKSVVEM